MKNEWAVEVAGARFRYGDREALAGVSFSVARGGSVAVLGPNGGGKSTLFRLLATLMGPQEGEFRVGGHSLRAADGVARARALLGVVFQSPALDPQLTARENLWCHGLLSGLRGPEARERIGELSGRLELGEMLGAPVRTLSGGQRRRVEIAKVLMTDPEILLLDEPSTGLDPGARRMMWRSLGALREARGTTILFTTHMTQEADGAERVLILDRGRLVADGAPSELKARAGGGVVTVRGMGAEAVCAELAGEAGVRVAAAGDALRIESADNAAMAARLLGRIGGGLTEVSVAAPSLDDVFFGATGRVLEGGRGDGREAA